MQVQKSHPPQTPQLLTITSLHSSIPKNRYILYYEIPIFVGQYKSIDEMYDVLLIDGTMRFKILDLEHGEGDGGVVYRESEFVEVRDKENKGKEEEKQKNEYKLSLKFGEGELSIVGKLLNKSSQDGIVYSLSVSQITGYLNFLKFRQKYRTLQNITRKQTFKLDHRLKITDNTTVFYFSLQQSDRSRYFFTSSKLQLQIQQIYSIQDWQSVQVIFQDVLDLTGVDGCLKAIINIMQKVKIGLNVELIRNVNLSVCQLAVLRMLEVGPMCGGVGVGTDSKGELASVEPVLQGRFYDYQYGYMNQNLKGEKNSTIYQHIDKLTKSFPTYPHLRNSKLLDISGSKFLTFTLNPTNPNPKNVNTKIKAKVQKINIPFVYILVGLNIIETENYTIKFYLEFSGEKNDKYPDKVEDRRRIMQVKIKDIWNLGSVAKIYPNFSIKITTSADSYTIPFTSQQVQVKQFRKQQKQLQLRDQYSYLQGNKYYILTRPFSNNNNNNNNSKESKKLLLTKSQSIGDFYLLDLFCSASINFQVVVGEGLEVVMQGTVGREEVVAVGDRQGQLRAILSSPDNLLKTILILSCSQIKHTNTCQRTYYKLLYKLQFTQKIPSDKLYYDLQLRRLTDNKKYRAKVFPQISDDGISTLHAIEDGFFESTAEDLELGVTLRKMYYDQRTEVFDNGEVVGKTVVVNAKPGHGLEKGCMFVTIKEEGYGTVDFDFYDENVMKRLRLHLEIFMKKLPLLDLTKGRYTVKIPQYLWQLNKTCCPPGTQITLQTHLSNRTFKGQKLTLFPDSPQEYPLRQYNHKDGLSIRMDNEHGREHGYDRIIDAIKVSCDVTKDQIGWIEGSQWYLGGIGVGKGYFWFMIKWGFDAGGIWDREGGSDDDANSQKSDRTAGKKGSERSYSQKIDPLAKTVKNMELFKLKQFRNNLVMEGRHLTTQFVKRQEAIISYTKKIADLEQKIAKTSAIQKQTTENTASEVRKSSSANYKKMAELYRKICQCGSKDPKYNGYCQDCLKALKTRYETYMKQYKQKSYEYQRLYFTKFNTKQKYIKTKNKLKHYKARLKAGQDIDDTNFADIFTQLQGSELKRKIQEARIHLFRLKEEREKLEESGQVRLASLEDMIRKEDEEIWGASTEMQRLGIELEELKGKIQKNGRNKE